MPRLPRVPDVLRQGPFTIAQALVAGVTPDQLRGRAWKRVSRGWYCWQGSFDDERRLRVVADSLPTGGAFAGLSAARLLGLDLPEPECLEVVVPDDSGCPGVRMPGSGVSSSHRGT